MNWIFLLVVLFQGCSTLGNLPSHAPDEAYQAIDMFLYDDIDSLNLAYTMGGGKVSRVGGFQYHLKNGRCQVHAMAGMHEAIAHEVAHCYYGSFHE